MADAGHVAWDMERFQFLTGGGVRQHPPVAHAAGATQPQLRAVRGDRPASTRCAGSTFQHHLRPRQDRLDRDRPADHRGSGAGGVEAVPGACRRRASGLGRDLLAHARRPLGRCARLVNEEDVRSGKVEVIAPPDFMDHTISENVYAGNAMNRRLFYQYGLLLPAAPTGIVGQGSARRCRPVPPE
jgi:hypothetical protein